MAAEYLITNGVNYITLDRKDHIILQFRGKGIECEPKKGYHLLAFNNIKFKSITKNDGKTTIVIKDYNKEVIQLLSTLYLAAINTVVSLNKDNEDIKELARKYKNNLSLKMPKENNSNRIRIWSWDSRWNNIITNWLLHKCELEVKIKQISIIESHDKDGKFFIYPKFEQESSISILDQLTIENINNEEDQEPENEDPVSVLGVDDDDLENINTEPTTPIAATTPSVIRKSESVYNNNNNNSNKKYKKN